MAGLLVTGWLWARVQGLWLRGWVVRIALAIAALFLWPFALLALGADVLNLLVRRVARFRRLPIAATWGASLLLVLVLLSLAGGGRSPQTPGTLPSAQPSPAGTAVAAVTSSPTPTEEPTSTPTPEPTAPPAPTPEPTPVPTPKPTASYKTFGDGTWEVGVDISAGTYRIREPASYCYWARLRGFGGTVGDIIANENVIDAYAVVTIGKTDAGFESDGCGEWTSDLSQVTSSKSQLIVDGTYIVGTDLSAGKWRSTGGDSCYWARLSGFGGTVSSIIANDNVSGATIVTIKSTDKGFQTEGCGTWTRQ